MRTILLTILILLAMTAAAAFLTVTEVTDDSDAAVIDPADIPVPVARVAVPVVHVPAVHVPVVDTPTVEIQSVETPDPMTVRITAVNPATGTVETIEMNLADIRTAQVTLVNPATGKAETIEVRLADASGATAQAATAQAATAQVATADAPTVPVPAPQVIRVPVPSPDGAEVAVIEVEVSNIAAPPVRNANDRIALWHELAVRLATAFHDQRGIQHDATLTPDNGDLARWLQIYANPPAVPPARTGMRQPAVPPRVIAEVRAPTTDAEWATLADNLSFYAGQGYNSALLAFDGDEPPSAVLSAARLVRRFGLELHVAYGGPESLRKTVFKDPRNIRAILAAVAPLARGVLLGWRRTSVHLFIQDRPFTDYIAACAREANPDIEIWGEGYFGQTADSGHSTRHLTYNMPEYAQGCILIGTGYASTNADGVLTGLYSAVSGLPRLALVLGDRPYYATRANNSLTFAENLAVKRAIEERFLAAGCLGTVTLHGDGSDGVYDESHTDNLSRTRRD